MVIEIIFYIFALITIVGALLVITSDNPVRAVLAKVLTFIAAAGVWMTLQAEYLSLLLVVVYVGAVMVMFLFVVMMLDIDVEAKKASFVHYWWLVLLIVIVFISTLIWVITSHFGLDPRYASLVVAPASQNDIKSLGTLMFTKYLYPFELAAYVLLAAMVAAITLVFRGKRKSNKSISAKEQISVNPKDRLSLVDIKPVKKTKKEDLKDD
jgi:NADH-quinone oxidoreductase subunit J